MHIYFGQQIYENIPLIFWEVSCA